MHVSSLSCALPALLLNASFLPAAAAPAAAKPASREELKERLQKKLEVGW